MKGFDIVTKLKKLFAGLSVKNFIGLTIAGIINALGVSLFLSPLGLIDGGLSGTSIFLDKITPAYLVLSYFLIILNFPFYLLAHKKIGKVFIVYSLFGIVIYSLTAFILENVVEYNYAVNGSPIVGHDVLLAALFGGLLSGVGSGMTIRFGGALDGVEVMAVLFAKKLGMTVGSFVMAYNVALYVVCAIWFKSWEIPLYSVVAYYVGIKTVDFIVDGLDKAKAAIIITDNMEEVAKTISDEFKRGVTVMDAKGFYSNTDKQVLYVVVNRFEVSKLKKLIMMKDPSSFVSLLDVSDTLGNQVKLGKVNHLGK